VLVGCKSPLSQKLIEVKPAEPVVEAKPAKAKEDSELLDAAKNGNIEVVKQRLAAGADVQSRCTECEGTALSHAASGGHIEIAELLIAAGADVNAKNDFGFTPLDNAEVYAGLQPWHATFDKLITDFIRKHGGKSGESLKAEESIQIAAKSGNIKAVKQHLAAGVDVNAKGSGAFGFGAMMGGGGERTPLSWATSGAHKEVAELLIAEGADVNAKDEHGGTPLHQAASWKKKEMVELLIAEGADVNAKSKYGRTALYVAAAGSPTSRQIRKEIVEQLIAKSADVNAKDKAGSTPLHQAANDGHKEIVELLIANGADVNAKDFDGFAPLHYAAWFGGNTETVVLLIAAGADVNVKNKGGVTPLSLAELVLDWQSSETKVAKKEIADLLRKHGGKHGEKPGEAYEGAE
jgi:ankyrin repeat protein